MCLSNIPTNLSVGGPQAAPQPTATSQQFPISYDQYNFSNKYNTRLSLKEEAMYQAWAAKNNRQNDTYDYDLRGAWKEMSSGKMKEDERGHLGDKYKKPNHPTFSDESVYHGVDGYVGGKWGKQGDKYTYTPSDNHVWSDKDLQRYFNEREKDAYLVSKRGGN